MRTPASASGVNLADRAASISVARNTQGAAPVTATRDTARGPGDEDADQCIARRRAAKLFVRCRERHREIDRGDDLVLPQRGLEHAGKERFRRNRALGRRRPCAESKQRSRIVRRRIVVGDRAADRSAVANLRIADSTGESASAGMALRTSGEAATSACGSWRRRDTAACDFDAAQPARSTNSTGAEGRRADAIAPGRMSSHALDRDCACP